MKTVLIWGFYRQGNLGDDLMGMMVYEMLEELGARPIIFTPNERFKTMGYRTVDNFAGLSPDFMVLGGGAFFKKRTASNQAIEEYLESLGAFVREKAIPVHGISLGSDGTSTLEAMSPARRALVFDDNFKSVTLRLHSDTQLRLKDFKHLPDIVLLTALCSERYVRLSPIAPQCEAPRTLVNLSRRSTGHLPRILWRERRTKMAFFRAHTGKGYTSGEVTLPGYETIDDDRVRAQLGYLAAADRIISAKLHPGVIALSYGKTFEPVHPRPKTIAFMHELRTRGHDKKVMFQDYMNHLKALIR